MPWYRFYYRLVGPSLFRWGGEFTWSTTGPASAGSTEPLPMPTTIVGALLGTRPGAELETAPEALLEEYGVKSIRGPYYPLPNGGIAVHVYPGRLLRLGPTGTIEALPEPLGEALARLAGTALRRDSKTVAQGMLYTENLVDPAGLERLGVRAEVSADLEAKGRPGIPPEPRRLGGELRLAIQGLDGDPRLAGIIQANPEPHYLVAATPLVLEGREQAEALQRGGLELKGCKLSAPTLSEATQLLKETARKHGLDPEAASAAAKSLRVKVEIRSLGVYPNGLPRRPHLLLMPGSLLKAENCTPPKLLQGLGPHRQLGFGTLIPIQPPQHP